MAIQRKVRKTGNSTVLSILKEVLERLNISDGEGISSY